MEGDKWKEGEEALRELGIAITQDGISISRKGEAEIGIPFILGNFFME